MNNQEKTFTTMECIHVISEPSDCTRYDYIVIQTSPDEYGFIPYRNTFKYPHKINYWDIKDISDVEISKLSDAYGCNFYTLKECIRTINELRNKEK